MRLGLAPALVFVATATDRGYLCDYWHHLARGRAMAESGQLVDADLFTFTVPGRSFEDVNWLSQLVYDRLDRAGGLALVQVVNALVLAGMMGLLVHFCWRDSGSTLIAGALGAFAFLGLWQSLTIRPQSFAFFLFVLLYEVVDLAERRPWLLVVPPLIVAVWANVHGSFPAALLLVGGSVLAAGWDGWRAGGPRGPVARRPLALALCLAACMLATLANPYGWRAYHFVANTSAVAGGRPIGEWLPPSPDLLAGKLWVASLVAVVAGFGLSRVRPTAREACLAVLFVPLAATSVRMVAWWVLIVTPVLARLMAANLPAQSAGPERPAVGPALCFGVMLLAVVLSLPGVSRFNPLLGPGRRERTTERQLDQAAAVVREHGAGGRIFSRFEWGEYLSCALGREYSVFMDGRTDIYPDEIWGQYAVISGGRQGWEDLLDRYRVDYLLLDAAYHAESGLLAQVERSPSWTPALRAGAAVLYVRRNPRLLGREVVVVEPAPWTDKRCPLLADIDIGKDLALGKWRVVFYRPQVEPVQH